MMRIAAVVKRTKLKDLDEDLENLHYWLSRPPHERVAAVTQLVQLSLNPGQQMDRTVMVRRKLHT